jgi:polyferredoxin
MLDDGNLENVYTLKILNKSEAPHRYVVSVSGASQLTTDPARPVFEVAGGEVYPAVLRVRRSAFDESGSETIEFRITAEDNPKLTVTHKARFLAPSTRNP